MKTIAECLDERRQVDADKVFVRHEAGEVTFAEFADEVDRRAVRLQEAGVRFGSLVGLMLDNHLDHMLSYFALARIGAVHLPISIHLKQAGLHQQLKNASPDLVVAERRFQDELAPALRRLDYRPGVWWRAAGAGEFLEDPSFAVTLPSPRWGPRGFGLDRIATLSYTSGTTGEPKGALLTERYLQHGAECVKVLARVDPRDVMFVWEPFYHLAAWNSVLMTLNVGCSVALVEKFSASRCWDQIRRYGATKLHYLGAVMGLLLKQPERADDRDNPVTVAWGAAAPATRWQEFENRFGLEIREGYGMTEIGAFTMLNLDGPIGSIGKPIEIFDAWIESSDGVRAEPKTTGEIVLKARVPDVTMIEYYRNPDATERLFSNGALHTGDLGYQDEDGYFYFVGRVTDNVRRRGENVSAWEVERIVRERADVVECAMIGVPSQLGEEDIKLFVQRIPDSDVTAEAILAWCSERLAYYQVPRYVEFVAEFPYGGTHRIMKTKLSRAVDGPDVFDAELAGIGSSRRNARGRADQVDDGGSKCG